MWRGGLRCLIPVAITTASFGFAFVLDRPSTSEAETLAQVGAALLIAYSVTMSWSIGAAGERGAQFESWIGFSTGLAVLGLLSEEGIDPEYAGDAAPCRTQRKGLNSANHIFRAA